MAKYTVRGADIWTKAGRANVGTVVELGAIEARYFNEKGVLAPYIEDDEPEPAPAEEPEPSTAEDDFAPPSGRRGRR